VNGVDDDALARGTLTVRTAVWLSLMLLVGAVAAVVGLVTVDQLFAAAWAGILVTLADGLLRAAGRPGPPPGPPTGRPAGGGDA
jgi:hypothetical protein